MPGPATRTAAVLLIGALVAAGCSKGGGDDDEALRDSATPTFPPAGADTPGSTVPRGSDPAGTATSVEIVGPGSDGAATGPLPRAEVRFDDAVGDTVGGVSPNPPPWTDLTSVTVLRENNAYAVRVGLAGGDAPETSNGVETLNIATFFDVDGDGEVDYEIWANLGPNGWGSGWFDDQGHAAYGEDTNVSISTRGDVVSILFPNVIIGTPTTMRLAFFSEYGDFDALGTDLARRDQIPDDGAGMIPFP